MSKARAITVLLLTILISCVGAIKEEEKIVKADARRIPNFTFEGISKISAISDTKLSVHFRPASGGGINEIGIEGSASVNFIYQIIRDGSSVPIATFVDSNLKIGSDGNYAVEISANGRGDCATYNIIATKADDLISISSRKFFTACSKDEYYPKYSGIFAAKPLPGCDLYTGSRISWKLASKADELIADIQRYDELKIENLNNFINGDINLSNFNATLTIYNTVISKLEEYAPNSYSVFYDENEAALKAKLLDPTTVANAIITDPNQLSFDLTDLVSGQTYYIAVRSSTSLLTDTAKKNTEQNIIILSYTVPVSTPIVFSGVQSVDVPKDISGYNQATLRFTPCEGCNKYYFYAFETPTAIDVNVDAPTAIVDLDLIPGNPDQFTLNGLTKHKNYNFYAVALKSCGGTISEDVGKNIFKSETTTPPLSPFNGIDAVSTVGGSLDRLELSWTLPDATNGVYDLYNIYLTQTDGTIIAQINNTPHATNAYIEASDDIGDPLTNSITILNVDAGVDSSTPENYCFVVAPKESNVNGPSGIGREIASSDKKVVCKDFFYQAPSFSGPIAGSCNATASTFEVAFPVPDDGTYSELRLYYKKSEGETFIDYSFAEGDTTGVLSDRAVGSEYTRIVFGHDPLATPIVKKPDFAPEDAIVNPFVITGLEPDTDYIFSMETYYDPDGAGVQPPFYVRPSIMRTCTTKKPEVVHEGWDHIMAIGNKTDGLNGGVVVKERMPTQTLNKFDYFMAGLGEDTEKLDRYFVQEDPVAATTKGIVHLSWFDFKFSSLGTYANSLAGGGAVMQYVVERSLNPDMAGATIIGTPITLVNGVFLYHYVDQNIPIAGRKYYYRIKLRKDNIDLQYASIDPTEAAINTANEILEVMVPPPNYAFIHRFMFNKHQCTRMDKTIYHGKHTYNDIKPDGSLDYDDMSGYDLRNARGSLYKAATHKNYDLANNYRCLYNGMGSTYDSIHDAYYFDIGKSFIVDRFEVGFKIGQNACDLGGGQGGPLHCMSKSGWGFDTKGIAASDTVFLQLGHYGNSDAFINTSVGGFDSNSWVAIEQLSEALFESKIDTIFSNEAYLPPARLQKQSNAKKVCSSRSVNINSINYNGRIGSRHEFVVFGGWYEQLSPQDIIQVNSKIDFGMGDELKNSCNTTFQGANRVPFQTSTIITDLTKNNYPSKSSVWDSELHLLRSGSYSDGTDPTNLYSSHLCFSKFGIQDLVGNNEEFTDDWFINSGTPNYIRLDTTKTPDDIKKYWLQTAKAPTLPLLPQQDDYFGSHMANLEGSFKEVLYNQRNYQTTKNFWNPLVGLSFECQDTVWSVTDCDDENPSNLAALLSQPDSDNSPFSSFARDKNNGVLGTPIDGSPGVLVSLAIQNDYIPFNYEFSRTYIRFPREIGISSPLSFGGSSMKTPGYESINSVNPDGNITSHRPGLYGAGYVRDTHTSRAAGFRCVFPIE